MKTKKIILASCGVALLSGCTVTEVHDDLTSAFTNTDSSNTGSAGFEYAGSLDGNIVPNTLMRFDVLRYVVEIAKRKKDEWLSRESSVAPFTMAKPVQVKDTTMYSNVVKDEFETNASFEGRTTAQNKNKASRAQSLSQQYQEQLSQYNKSLKDYKSSLAKEKSQRLAIVDGVYKDYVEKTIEEIFGAPFVKDLTYSADLQQFTATLYSQLANFSRSITIDVPISVARDFKSNSIHLKPDMKFELNERNDSLYIADISVSYKDKTYPARISKSTFKLEKNSQINQQLTVASQTVIAVEREIE
jgi:uncharacterized protein YdaT